MYVPRFVMFLPLLIGALIGGPLIARELETGTFRFAWTQSAGRTRWAIAKLAILGLALTAMALAFSALFAWWYRPFEQLTGPAAEVEGVVFAVRVLFGFTLGAFAGAVLRRTVPAIAAQWALVRRRRADGALPEASFRGAAHGAGRHGDRSSRPNGP